MKSINPRYRKTPESLISYDFIDVIENIGYMTYYGIYQDSSNTFLSRQAVASQSPKQEVTATAVSPDWTDMADIDWDLQFNVSQVVKGDLFVECCFDTKTTSNAQYAARVDVTVYHYDGTNETSIGTATGTGVSWAANKAGSYRTVTKVELDETTIPAGDYLRVATLIKGRKGSSGSNPTWDFWHDGAARGATTNNQIDPDENAADLGYTNTTDLKVFIPFKIVK